MIRSVIHTDAAKIANIYNHYISNTTVTFEEQVIDAAEIKSRLQKVEDSNLPWLVAEENGELVGYAYATKWKPRSAYRHSVEVSVYVDHQQTGKGWGTKLYQALFSELLPMDIHLVIGGITLPNIASVALHEKLGMEKVAHFKEIGFKFGEWRDVGYWQMKLP